MRPRPVCTLVAVTNSLTGASTSRSKSTLSARILVSGFDAKDSCRRARAPARRCRRRRTPASSRASSCRSGSRSDRAATGSSALRPTRASRTLRARPARLRVRRAASPSAITDGVHRARRRAGDAVEVKPRLLEQPVEHAPGEGTVRAAALQAEVDGHDRAFRRRAAACRARWRYGCTLRASLGFRSSGLCASLLLVRAARVQIGVPVRDRAHRRQGQPPRWIRRAHAARPASAGDMRQRAIE